MRLALNIENDSMTKHKAMSIIGVKHVIPNEMPIKQQGLCLLKDTSFLFDYSYSASFSLYCNPWLKDSFSSETSCDFINFGVVAATRP